MSAISVDCSDTIKKNNTEWSSICTKLNERCSTIESTHDYILNQLDILKKNIELFETKVIPFDDLLNRSNKVHSQVETLWEDYTTNSKHTNEISIIQHNLSIMKKELNRLTSSANAGNSSDNNNNNNNNNSIPPYPPTTPTIPLPASQPPIDTPPLSKASQSNQPTFITSCDQSTNTQSISNDKPVDRLTTLLVCMDSNRKFIDHRLFWRTDGASYVACSKIESVKKTIMDTHYENLKTILISCGVNDIDTKIGSDVAHEILDLLEYIKQNYPNVKIVLSEVTPRNDELDEEVKKCNKLVATSMTNKAGVFFVKQHNLRDSTWSLFYDNKHITKNGIRKFAANLKVGLRNAYGIKSRYGDKRQSTAKSNTQTNFTRTNFHINDRLRNVAGYPSNEYADLKSVLLERFSNVLRDL